MISSTERGILRELAKQQREIALSDSMQKLRQEWYLHNDIKGGRPMVSFEMWTCQQDLMPPFSCTSPEGQMLERQMLTNIVNYRRIKDDRVVPENYTVGMQVGFKPFDIVQERQTAIDSTGNALGFHLEPALTDLEEEMEKLGETSFSIDAEGAARHERLAQDTFGDILPVVRSGHLTYLAPSRIILDLMGMENMMVAFMTAPEAFHKAMRKITDMVLRANRIMEESGFLTLNNSDNTVPQGTQGFTRDLPAPGFDPGKLRLKDIWGYMDSQETVGVSPEAFQEFFAPYYHEIAQTFGLLNYGCCEPVDLYWENSLKDLHGLRKVSISPWCNIDFMGEALRGGKVIFHRKPSPNFVGVGGALDEEGFRAYIRETVKAASGCPFEISFRDIYTLGGYPDKPSRVVAISKEEIETHWKPY